MKMHPFLRPLSRILAQALFNPCCLFLLLLGLGHSPAVEISLLSPLHSPRPGAILEWELADIPEEWLDNRVTHTPFLIIDEGNGKRWQRPAFVYQAFRSDPQQRRGEFAVDGERVLRLRHSPRSPGLLRWALYGPGMQPDTDRPLQDGRLRVLDGPLAGAISQAAHNRHLLAHPDGQAFIPIGLNIAWAVDKDRDRLATYLYYLDRLQAVGGNHIRMWCASWFAGIEGEQPLSWRLDQAWLLDQALEGARQRGLAVTLVLDNHSDFLEGQAFPYGATREERGQGFFQADLPEGYRQRLRYLVARYGHLDHILAWELFNEVNLTQVSQDRLQTWAASALGFLKDIDPYERLRSLSWTLDDWPEMRDLEDLSLLQVHRYVAHFDHLSPKDMDIIARMAGDAVTLLDDPRPFLFAEVGYHGHHPEDVPGNQEDPQGLLLSHKAWAGLLLGGAGSGMNWWWDSWVEQRDLWHLYRPLVAMLGKIDWNDPGLRPMRPLLDQDFRVIGWQSDRQALLWPHSRHSNWYARILGSQENPDHGRRFALRLHNLNPNTRFMIQGRGMQDGSIKTVQEGRSDAQGQLLITLPPYHHDQLLLLRALAEP